MHTRKCAVALLTTLILGWAAIVRAQTQNVPGNPGYIWQAGAVADACEDGDAPRRAGSDLQMINVGMCVGFVSAVEDYLEDSGYQLTDRKNNSRAEKAFRAYVVLHPELRSKSGRAVMISAWLEAGLIRHSQ
jgi:hypothetical protein